MSQRLVLIVIIAIGYLSTFFYIDRWGTTLYFGDSSHYYLHVVSFFVNQDVGDYDKTITSLREINPRSKDPRKDKYGIRLTDKGRQYIKYTLGVPVMETPFFLVAHAYALISKKYEPDGWTSPYLLSVGLATIFYILLGFYLLVSVLQRYFKKDVVAVTVLSIAFATNLFYHGTFMAMSHGFLFFDYCLLIWLTVRFYDSPSGKKAFLLGMVVGLIALTRVPEVISALIPLLWGITSIDDLKKRAKFIAENYKLGILAGLAFTLVFSIQVAYWYYTSGKLFFDPYAGEGFDFLHPNILKGWFSFSNGWLIYTPIMGLSLIGWFKLRKYCGDPWLPTLLFVGLHIYIHYSYYVWSYYPGFGQRPMIETYAIFSFALAAFYAYCFRHRFLKWLPYLSVLLFTMLNLFQTWQMREGIIWAQRGNRPFYFATFGLTKPTLSSFRAYDTSERQPDTSSMRQVKLLLSDDFEDVAESERSATIKNKGLYSFYLNSDNPAWRKEIKLSEVRANDWLEIGIHAYFKRKNKVNKRDLCATLVVEIYDGDGRRWKWRSLNMSSHIGNSQHSIWSTGTAELWGKAAFFMKMPGKINNEWRLKVHLLNDHNQKIFLDDFFVSQYREY